LKGGREEKYHLAYLVQGVWHIVMENKWK
jgi:hypothetical protein